MIEMEADDKWYFTKEQLSNTPSRKCGYDADKELSCRQQAANFIQDMGQRLQVTQLCINTAIVYMHRFYVFHSFTRFHRNAVAAASLFLAAKVEEQPRKLEHVIKVAQMCLHREMPALDTKSDTYLDQASDLVVNENVLLQTLGFDVAIDHPHTHVVRCCHLVKASKDLAQTSYFMASNSLHLTTMCLQYKPTVVACFCIHLACKWSNWEIPLSNESKSWFWYVDKTVTQELLEQLTNEFLTIFDKCPSRLKRKISANQNMAGYHMGVNELNQKRLPGTGGNDPQPGVSFQHPIARHRNTADDNRKKPDGVMLPPSHRQMAPPEPKKQPPHTATRDSAFGSHHLPGTSQASSSYQVPNAQFLYPPPSIPGPSSNGPNSRLPNPSVPKHAVRPEAMFPPPKRSHMGPPPPRPVKTEFQTPPPQPPKAHSQSHHVPRNGTSHNLENFAQTPIKTESMPVKYPASMDKHSSSHQKGHSKIYDNPRGNQPVGGNWTTGDTTTRNSMVDMKYNKNEIKTEPSATSTSYHNIQGNLTIPSQATASLPKSQSSPPPPPLPLLPPPPPPPPPPTQVQSSKPSSIFSPDKMTPPLPNSPSREGKCLSPLLLSPISSSKTGRNRTSSSSSEPELIPVMTKLEEMLGYESLGKGKTGIKISGKASNSEAKVKDSVQYKEKPKEVPTSHTSNDQKSFETAQSLDANIAKPIVGVNKMIDVIDLTGHTKREHKKKKKHKEHREHREKDKEKEKKKDKHKDKHREKDKDKYKHRGDPAPIKITIPKDKINNVIIPDKFPPPNAMHEQGAVLKIKIPKDKIMKTHIEQSKTPSSLKIKISKDAISSHSSSKSSSSSGSSSRKRERSSQRDNDDDSYSHVSKHSKLSKSTNGDLDPIL